MLALGRRRGRVPDSPAPRKEHSPLFLNRLQDGLHFLEALRIFHGAGSHWQTRATRRRRTSRNFSCNRSSLAARSTILLRVHLHPLDHYGGEIHLLQPRHRDEVLLLIRCPAYPAAAGAIYSMIQVRAAYTAEPEEDVFRHRSLVRRSLPLAPEKSTLRQELVWRTHCRRWRGAACRWRWSDVLREDWCDLPVDLRPATFHCDRRRRDQ